MTQAEFNQFIESTCSATIVDPDRPLVDQGIDSLGTVSYTHLTLPTSDLE